jgi:hypothetical protein
MYYYEPLRTTVNNVWDREEITNFNPKGYGSLDK